MRRLLWVFAFTVASLGILAVPAGALIATPSDLNPIVLSFDFSNNTAPASASNGLFNINIDVLPEHTPGVVRVTADAPDGSGNVPVVCAYQPIQQSQVSCAFNFTTSGLWTIRADYATDAKSPVEAFDVTVLRVGN